MEIKLEPGKYVIAVSGGVDSMVLLDVLAGDGGFEPPIAGPKSPSVIWAPEKKKVQLVVAHFDHGIRTESSADRQFVQAAAARYDVPFVYEEGKLGPDASEAAARAARYSFLRRAMLEHGAIAILTAHHQSDARETAIINLLRGTGPCGLSALGSTADVRRPLLDTPKQRILDYARQHNIAWREDRTNYDERFLRNYVRLALLPRLTANGLARLDDIIRRAAPLRAEIDREIARLLATQTAQMLDRQWFIMLPHAVAAEVLAAWLRQNGMAFDRKTIARLIVFCKTAQPGKQADIDGRQRVFVTKHTIKL